MKEPRCGLFIIYKFQSFCSFLASFQHYHTAPFLFYIRGRKIQMRNRAFDKDIRYVKFLIIYFTVHKASLRIVAGELTRHIHLKRIQMVSPVLTYALG